MNLSSTDVMIFQVTLICFTDSKKTFVFVKMKKLFFEGFWQFSAEIETLFQGVLGMNNVNPYSCQNFKFH